MTEVLATADSWPCFRYALDGSITPTSIIKEATVPDGVPVSGKPRTSREAATYLAP